MKELLTQYANYNIWANKRIIEGLLKLAPEQLDSHIESSFSSIRKTAYHSWGAEDVWWQRIQLIENWRYVGEDLDTPIEVACEKWIQVSEDLRAFIEKQFDDKALEHVFQYYDSEKVLHKQPVGLTLMHVFNHATYHRGQIITMLRQAGVTKIPYTDFMGFVRRK
ncbi:MAG: hypothetical protein JST82_11755 [Bacteroidetes bacterium]|nr:hypothetical protein [Bacteroidota bacterium]